MAVLAMLEAHPAPSVALVQGAAFGAGFELACACDFRVGTPDAVFCMPPARLGMVYAPEGYGGWRGWRGSSARAGCSSPRPRWVPPRRSPGDCWTW